MFTALIIVATLCLTYVSLHWVLPRLEQERRHLVHTARDLDVAAVADTRGPGHRR